MYMNWNMNAKVFYISSIVNFAYLHIHDTHTHILFIAMTLFFSLCHPKIAPNFMNIIASKKKNPKANEMEIKLHNHHSAVMCVSIFISRYTGFAD